MPAPALVCTMHDPTGALLSLATDDLLATLARLFSSVSVVCTPTTLREAERRLEAAGVTVERSDGKILPAYQRALRLGIARAAHLLYADFDRLIHWQRTYPRELETVAAEIAEVELTVCGRTPRAFATHPACQRLTEGPVNELVAHLYRQPPCTDIFASCWGLSRSAATLLVDLALPPDGTLYLVWPLALWRRGVSWRYIATEGLEWETPDVHAEAIASGGYDAWLQQFESPQQWLRRTDMSASWLRALIAFGSGTWG